MTKKQKTLIYIEKQVFFTLQQPEWEACFTPHRGGGKRV